jgi:hypothetical protein
MNAYRFALAASLALTSLGCQSFATGQGHAAVSAPLFSQAATRPLDAPTGDHTGGLVVARFDRDSFALEPELGVQRSIALPPIAVDPLGLRQPVPQDDPASRVIDATTLLLAPSFTSSDEPAAF